MAKKSELLTKKWSELTEKQQKRFKSKEEFKILKRDQPTTTPTPTPTTTPTPTPTSTPTPDKPKTAATLAIQKDKDKEDIEFPLTAKGEEFRKYKPQGNKIRGAAKADLAAKMRESFKPKVLEAAKTLKEKFLGDKTKKPKELTGRAKRQYRIDKIGKVEKPKFKTYKDKVKDIRKGEGEAVKYAYSTRFRNLGEQLGIGYTRKERRIRTKKRLRKLNLGTQGAYETTAKSRKRRRESGKQIIASMGIS